MELMLVQQAVAEQLEQICSFSKLPPTVPAANILLLGPAGAGKSSLVSTLDSLLEGVMTRRAEYGGATTTLTLALRKYTFPAPSGQMLPLVLWDTRGWCPASYCSGAITQLHRLDTPLT
jgi:predicted GTPase